MLVICLKYNKKVLYLFFIIYSRRAPVLKTFHLHLSQHKFNLDQRILRLYWPRGMFTVKTSKPLYNYFPGWMCPFFRTHNCCSPVIIICQNFWKTMVTNVAVKNYESWGCYYSEYKQLYLPTLLYVYHLFWQIKIYSMSWVSECQDCRQNVRSQSHLYVLLFNICCGWSRVLMLISIFGS